MIAVCMFVFTGLNVCRAYGNISGSKSSFHVDIRKTTDVKYETT